MKISFLARLDAQKAVLICTLHFVMQMKKRCAKRQVPLASQTIFLRAKTGKKHPASVSDSKLRETDIETWQTFLLSFLSISLLSSIYLYLWGLSLTRKSLTAHRDSRFRATDKTEKRYALPRQ